MTDLTPGSRVAGYRVERLIGSGAMGSVYLATEVALDRRVALKVIRPELAGDDRFRRRFLLECKLIARLEHPGIVPVYSAGESGGRLFIAMRYLSGGSLEERLRPERPLAPAETVAMLSLVADALDAAHAAGIVHRDVKPGNILLEGFGAFLCDFGLARRAESVGGFGRADGLTVSGTLSYVAPEQLEGDTIDGRADQYALACVVFQCLAGRPPFLRDAELAVVYAHLSEPPPSLSGLNPAVPSAVDHAIGRGLAKRPEDRFATCAELLAAVEAALRLTWADGAAPPPLVAVSGAIDSPYRGLNAFEERDAPFFFGREAAATALMERMSQRLEASSLLVISGVSGAGKSSLLRAGVLPRLRKEGLAGAPESATWPCLVFTPGRAPLDELAVRVALLARADAAAVRRGLETEPAGFALTARQAALVQGGVSARDGQASGSHLDHRLLLVVDQFEQLFTQCPDEGQRRAFVTALHAAAAAAPGQAPAVLVVLSVRADFEAHCADYAQLADAVQDRYLVTSMTDRQLRMAITEPAKQAGSRVEDDLVDVLLGEISTRGSVSSGAFPVSGPISGARVLPLLSHALDQAWRNRSADTLTLADYERTGGIEGAVAESAQRAYDGLTPAAQAAARQVFIRLTATTADGVDTADQIARTELIDGRRPAEVDDVETVLEAFAAERLLTLAADTVELSHEVVLTAWPLLRDTWLAETRADRIVRTRLHNVAAEWTRDSRDQSYLYTGTLLETATDTAARADADPVHHPPLTTSERDFLRASDQARRRRVFRRRTFIAALMVLVVGFAAAAFWALRASQNAAHQRDVAVAGQLIAQSEDLGDANPAIAKLESVAAWRIHPSDDARYAMLSAAAHPGLAILGGHTGDVQSVAFSPDGKMLASGSTDDTVRLWDVATRRSIGVLTGHNGDVLSVAFSPDGKMLASGSTDDTVRLWDVATRRSIGVLTGHNGDVQSVVFSPNGKMLASGSHDKTVRLWNITKRQQIASLTGHTNEVWSVAFSPDGKTLASGSVDNTVRLWNVATHRPIGTPLTGHSRDVQSVAFSPDGKTLASGSVDGTARLWNVATHRPIGNPLTGHSGDVRSVAFSPDGQTLATGSADDTVRLWDVVSRRPIGAPLTGHTGDVLSVAFSPDGQTLASSSADNTVRLWNVVSRRPIGAPLTGHSLEVLSAAFSRDGRMLASGSFDGTVRLWNVATRQGMGVLFVGRSGVPSVAFSPDGQLLASGSFDGTLRLWNVATRRPIWAAPTGYGNEVLSVAFSRDGRMIASGSFHGTVRLWDVASGRPIGDPLAGHRLAVHSVAFSPDGRTLASGSFDDTVRLWDVATGQPIGSPLAGNTNGVLAVAFSPDGKTVISVSTNEMVRLWRVATRRPSGAPLVGGSGDAPSVAISPDGKTLATGSLDGTVRLWDVATRQPIGEPLIGHTGAVPSVAFSADGKTLATGSADHTVRLWDVAYLVDPVESLCASTSRPFTRDDWRNYIPRGPAYRRLCP